MAIEFVAGVIRYIGGNWILIDDAAHTSLNIKGVDTKEDSVVIYYAFKAKKVISLIAAPDETYAKAGISMGASVGLDRAYIQFGDSGGSLSSSQMEQPSSNIWILGIMEV